MPTMASVQAVGRRPNRFNSARLNSTRSSFRNFKSALSMRKTVRHNNHFTLKSIGERSTTHILDLPEEIFRIIFSYIAEAEVYFKLRVVCSQLREYAEKYVELGIKILVTAGADWEMAIINPLPSEILYVFKRNQKVISLYSKLGPAFPGVSNYYGTFSGLCDGHILVGQNRLMYTYNYRKNQWLQLPWENDCMRNFASSCAISNSSMVIAGHAYDSNNKVQLFRLNDSPIKRRKKRKLISCFLTSKHHSHDLASHWITCPTKLPITVQGHTIINISENQVILVGGIITGFGLSGRAFIGKLKAEEYDVKWVEIPSVAYPRTKHMCFKLGPDVFIAGGYGDNGILSSIEKFNLKEEKWETHTKSLPCPLTSASVVVDPDETYAVITGGLTSAHTDYRALCDNHIIFTLEDVAFSKSSLRKRRSQHISMRIR